MTQVRGLYRLEEQEDVPPVRFFIRIEDSQYVGALWTDDGRLDKVARARDDSSESLSELEYSLEQTAVEWLLAECKLRDA